MKSKTWAELAAKKVITNKNISVTHYYFGLKELENYTSGKIVHEKQRFSTAC